MSLADNRAIAYRVYEAINAQDVATLDELFDPNIIRHAAGEVGIQKAREALQKAFAGGAIKRFVVEDVLVDGDKAALLGDLDHLLDSGIGKVEERSVCGLGGGFGSLFVFLDLRCHSHSPKGGERR